MENSGGTQLFKVEGLTSSFSFFCLIISHDDAFSFFLSKWTKAERFLRAMRQWKMPSMHIHSSIIWNSLRMNFNLFQLIPIQVPSFSQSTAVNIYCDKTTTILINLLFFTMRVRSSDGYLLGLVIGYFKAITLASCQPRVALLTTGIIAALQAAE